MLPAPPRHRGPAARSSQHAELLSSHFFSKWSYQKDTGLKTGLDKKYNLQNDFYQNPRRVKEFNEYQHKSQGKNSSCTHLKLIFSG